jgi:hypothetical protein
MIAPRAAQITNNNLIVNNRGFGSANRTLAEFTVHRCRCCDARADRKHEKAET